MKKTVKLYAARCTGGGPYIYNEKLIPQGHCGVCTHDNNYPSSGDMVNAKGLFEMMGIPFPEGATLELDITVTEPRKKGWYPVTLNAGNKRILYYDGSKIVDTDSEKVQQVWSEYQFQWIADEPIPDPFERVP